MTTAPTDRPPVAVLGATGFARPAVLTRAGRPDPRLRGLGKAAEQGLLPQYELRTRLEHYSKEV